MEKVQFKNRPISPHVTVFQLGWTSTMSILHRVTGILFALYLLSVVLGFKFLMYHMSTYWIYELGYHLNDMKGFILSFLSFLLCIIFSKHFISGIRHLIWDTGTAFEPSMVKQHSLIVISLTFILGTIIWITL